MTVAAFMDLALYDPAFGYYARAAQRSGRAGDFFTSVDVGPLFGDLLELQIAEMAGHSPVDSRRRQSAARVASTWSRPAPATGGCPPTSCARQEIVIPTCSIASSSISSKPARRRGAHNRRRSASSPPGSSRRPDSLPDTFEGILVANELLDALPVHQVVMREDGLREVYVESTVDSRQSHRSTTATVDWRLTTIEGPLSTPALADYLARLGVVLESGWRVEINLRAVEWIRQAARQLRRGFIILVDYGHEARELYSASHASGTLTTFAGHTMAGPEAKTPAWLERPGDQDITAHVDFTSVRDGRGARRPRDARVPRPDLLRAGPGARSARAVRSAWR